MEQTANDILKVLETWAAEKRPIDPGMWLDAAAKLNALQGDEDDKLFRMQQICAQTLVGNMEQGKSFAHAKARVEASDLFRDAKIQKAKVERIKETIRLAKLRGRMANEEMRSQ